MADRPIIFSAPMVRAILDGRKSQTRRILGTRTSPCRVNIFDGTWSDSYVLDPGNAEWRERYLPCASGDRLYVREAWTARMTHGWTIADARSRMFQEEILYRADRHDSIDGWWPSIHMPREFSRLTLIVTDVRVQRLQDISEADAVAEGLVSAYEGWATDADASHWGNTAVNSYRVLWNDLHGADAWDANPWVAAISFTVHRGNIDQMEAAHG